MEKISPVYSDSIHTLQKETADWVVKTFGEASSNDTVERPLRFLEESLELVQSMGLTKEEALNVVNYVYDRPVGETFQEIGGVLLTLSALASAVKVSLGDAWTIELIRAKANVDKILAKQASKPKGITADTFSWKLKADICALLNSKEVIVGFIKQYTHIDYYRNPLIGKITNVIYTMFIRTEFSLYLNPERYTVEDINTSDYCIVEEFTNFDAAQAYLVHHAKMKGLL